MTGMYWNGNGAEQAKYNELERAVQDEGWKLLQATVKVFNSYYRYFNDGDFPGWARGDWSIQRMGRWGKMLNDKGLEMQENRVTAAVLQEYARYMKTKEVA